MRGAHHFRRALVGPAATAAAMLWCGGCTRSPPDRSTAPLLLLHDFAAEAPLADVQQETLRIEMGTAAARGRLIRGWSGDEPSGPEGSPFVWSSGAASLLDFFLSEPRPLSVEFHAFPFADPIGQRVSVRVNGRLGGDVEMAAVPRTYELRLAPDSLLAGVNRLEFDYAFTRIPARAGHGSTDLRALAVGWNWIGFWPPDGETTSVDLGTPAGHPFQIAGWSEDQARSDGSASFVWGVGNESRLRFFVRNVRDRPVSFRCSTAPFGRENRQTVQVEVNGHPIGAVQVDGQFREHRLTVSRTALRAGTNEIKLVYAQPLIPIADAPSNANATSIAWERVRFADEEANPSALTAAAANPGTIRIAAGTRIDYYVVAKSGAQLAVDEVRPYGDPRCRLRFTSESDPGRERMERQVASAVRFPIPFAAAEVMRLSFASICPEGRRGGTILGHPTLRGPGSSVTSPVPLGAEASSRGRKLPTVIVYVVDTLRADHLGCYGYPRPVSPAIDFLASDGLLFTQARSHTSWTRPAVASLLTGLDPRAHGVVDEDDGLPPDTVLLAEVLRSAGYRTGAVVTNAHVGRSFGFAKGFDFFREREERAARVTTDALEWLDRVGRDRPRFLYLHTIEPHDPYEPPAHFRREFAGAVQTPGAGSDRQLTALLAKGGAVDARVRDELVNLYDAEIAANDAAFGVLIAGLRARGMYDDALIVFCADHGEEFGEHGAWRHGHSLYEELVDIPLIVKPPGARPNRGRRVAGFVQPADVYATILSQLGLAADGELQGRAITGIGGGETRVPEPQRVFFSLDLGGHRTVGVQDREWKLIRESGTEAHSKLYNLREDPAETRDLFDVRPVRAHYLLELLRGREQSLGRGASPRQVKPDAALLERLRALGYAR